MKNRYTKESKNETIDLILKCDKKHFKALNSDVELKQAKDLKSFSVQY